MKMKLKPIKKRRRKTPSQRGDKCLISRCVRKASPKVGSYCVSCKVMLGRRGISLKKRVTELPPPLKSGRPLAIEKARWPEVVERWNKDEPAASLARDFGCTPTTVYRTIKRILAE